MSAIDMVFGDDAAFRQSIDRLGYAAETLKQGPVTSDFGDLLSLFTILGKHIGFEVRSPGLGAIDRSSDPVRTIAHASRLRYRALALEPGWTAKGATSTSFLTTMQDPEHGHTADVAVLATLGTLQYQRSSDPAPRALTPQLEHLFASSGLEFYPPLVPTGPARLRDLFTIGLKGTAKQWLTACLMALGVSLLGLLTPIITNAVIGTFIPLADTSLVIQLSILLVTTAVAILAFSLVQNFAVSAISQVATKSMQASLWNRLISLPPTFYRDFSAGDLVIRSIAIDNLQSLVSAQVISAVLAAGFGLINVALMFYYNSSLALVAVAVLAATIGILILLARSMQHQAERSLDGSRHANGWLIQVLNGIVKIRLAHAEARMAALYLDRLQENIVAQARSTAILGRLNGWFMFLGGAASAGFYLVILATWGPQGSSVSSANYVAFLSAYALAFGAVSGLVALVGPLVQLGPTLKLLQPILMATPETSGGQQDPGTLTGAISLRDVQFSYPHTGVPVIKGLSVDIPAGKMVAITGPSGCGKSTLTRLILGFDTPDSGQILFDGRSLGDLDVSLVRQQMGVVIQNGRITKGTIATNIGGNPDAPADQVWQAAEEAAIADDLRRLPLGLNTVVDPETISGGQAQRLLLARALYRRPRIMILDEATSALDNEAQEVVTRSMEQLHMTRLVIAHRLSTLRQADVIVVMEAGQICQQGSFNELKDAPGLFAELLKRQLAA